MCVTECLHRLPLPSLQMGRTPGLRRLCSCHTTCLSVGSCYGEHVLALYVCACVCETGKCQQVLGPHYNQLNCSRVMSSRTDGKKGSQGSQGREKILQLIAMILFTVMTA